MYVASVVSLKMTSQRELFVAVRHEPDQEPAGSKPEPEPVPLVALVPSPKVEFPGLGGTVFPPAVPLPFA